MYDLYLNAFNGVVNEYAEHHYAGTLDSYTKQEIIKRVIFYGVKMINAKEIKSVTREEVEMDFQLSSTIKGLIEKLTPAEFITIFPIAKEFDGKRWQSKDYFYTKDYINTLDPKEPIGNALHFLWEYHNWEIVEFSVNILGFMSDLRKLDGYPSLVEEFMDDNGVPSQNIHKTSKGDKFVVIKGKPVKLSKSKIRASHLQLVE